MRCCIRTIEKIIVSEKTDIRTDWFTNATGLENVEFQGVIAKSIDFSSCPLTPESVASVISCLKDYSGTDKEGVYTVTFRWQSLSALEAITVSPSGGTWSEYIESLGWLT